MTSAGLKGGFENWRGDAGRWLRAHGLELWIITGIWAVLTVVIYLLAIGHESPRRYQDEFLFWALAKNFAHGDGLTWRGVGIEMKSWLYPVLLAPAFWISDTVPGEYTGVHLINSMMIVGTIFPAYLMARLFLGRWTALVAALLAVAVPAMNYAGIIGTENLGYLTFTAACGGSLLALARPSWRNAGFAVVLVLVAALTRTQFVVMLPGLFASALLVAWMREPGKRRAYIASQRPLLGTLGVLFVLGGLVFLVQGRGAVGLYGGIFDGIPLTASALWFWVKAFSADIYLMTAVVPVIATTAMFARSENRRDPLVGALLAFTLVTTLLLLAQVSWFSATNPYDWRTRHIFYERYMFYLGPLFFTGLLVAWHRVSVAAALVSVAVATVIVSGFQTDAVLIPFSYDSFGLSLIGRHMELHPDSAAKIGITLARLTLFIGIFYVVSTVKRDSVARIFHWALVIFTFAVLVATQWQTWDYARTFSKQAFEQVPKPANFIDQNTDQDVGMIITSTDAPEMYFQTEFWNNRIVKAYATDATPIQTPIMYSPKCDFEWSETGEILGGGECPDPPNAWYLRSETVSMHLKDEIKRVHPAPQFNSLTLMVGLPPARILSMVDGRAVANGLVQGGTMNVRTFLDDAGELRLRFGRARAETIVRIGGNAPISVRPGKTSTVTVKIPANEKLTTVTFRTGDGEAAVGSVAGLDVREPDGPWKSIL